ncbi:MAG: FtsW/RodA/SpoVE family cell cycle protein [Clostridia bacterium]|nr:FtsW/RodA/SpoVE family cell cycle protein [Clostridia bacterium]
MTQILADIAVVGLRILLVVYAVFIIYQCFASMRRHKRQESPLVMLYNETIKEKIPVLCWENSIGRSKGSDIVIADPTVSRNHCVLLRRKEGWFVSDSDSKSGTLVNGKEAGFRTPVYIDDKITVGSTTLQLRRGEEFDEEVRHHWFFSKTSGKPSVSTPLLLILINLFHLFMAIEICITFSEVRLPAFEIWLAMVAFSWVLYAFSRGVLGRLNFELESIALFLTGTGALLLVEQEIRDAWIQVIAAVAGAVFYLVILQFIKNPDRIVKWRMAIMLISLGFLLINLIFGVAEFGATNRIYIAGVSVQPSELVKVAYIFVGASALDHLQTKRNLLEFIVFSALCVGALALMGDFGTALIFFVTFLVISITRSGDYKTVILAVVAVIFAGMLVLQFKPYIADRFAIWGHALEDPYDAGYQQAGVLTYIASGGFFGTGVGGGVLKYYGASETDLVFGIVSEEMGFIIALTIAMTLFGLVIYSRAIGTRSRSTFYSISAVCAASMMLFQSALNIFGCTDILPLTGVTLPFISAGGSSMLSCWGMLAFIKAADERTYSANKLNGPD